MENFDLKLINTFVRGAIESLSIQGGLTIEAGKPFVKDSVVIPAISISSQLGLVSKGFKGVISINFEEKVFLKMLSNMFGEAVLEINVGNQDGAAEILNQTYGYTKAKLNPEGYTFEQAIPTVTTGQSLKTTFNKNPALVIPLRALEGFIFVEVSVLKK